VGVFISGSIVHLLRVGLLEPKAPTDTYSLVGKAYTAVVFVGVAVAPTWAGEAVAVFTAFLALAIAWLIAVPLTMESISTADLGLLGRGLRQWRRAVVAVAKERKVSLDEEAATGTTSSSRLWRLLTPLAPFAILQLIYRQSLRSMMLGVMAVAGLLIGPTLERWHWGYWSPVAVLLALSVPLAGRIVGVLLLPVLFQVYLAGLKADQASRRILGEDKDANQE
jgi:hypothetical protein